MYHYVRDGARVHARTVAELEAELDHVAERYTCVRLEDVVGGAWPDDACVLTFDDGLVEHLDVVAPALEERDLTGVFCPPGRAVVERRPLDVQRTQFLLASTSDHEALGRRILAAVDDPDRLWAENTPPHRYDAPATVFVKRALQEGLPEGQREELLVALFHEHVTDDDEAFADSLYLTLDGCTRARAPRARGGRPRLGAPAPRSARRARTARRARADARVRRGSRRDVGALLPVREPERDDVATAPRARLRRRPRRPSRGVRHRPTRCSSCRGSTRTTYSSR